MANERIARRRLKTSVLHLMSSEPTTKNHCDESVTRFQATERIETLFVSPTIRTSGSEWETATPRAEIRVSPLRGIS